MINNIKEKLKKNKKQILWGVIIFFMQCLILLPWFKGHMSGDDYTIANIGYKEYIKNFSLNDGRIFAGWMIAIYDLCNFNIEVSAIISLVVSLIICSISIVYLKNIIENIKPAKNIWTEIIIAIISFVTIFNFMNIDCLYFIEGPVIEGSILIVLMAINTLIKEEKHYNVKSLILITLAVFVYQATVFIAIPLTLLFTIIKSKGSIKKIIINLIKMCCYVLVGIVLNLLFIKGYNIITNLYTARAGINLERMYKWILFIPHHLENIFFVNFFYFVPGAFIIVILATVSLFIIYLTNSKINNKIYLSIMIIALVLFFIICNEVVFIITNSSLGSGRMNLCLGMLIGAVFIYIYTMTNIFDNNKLFKIIMTVILIIYCSLIIYKTEEIVFTISNIHERDKSRAIEICEYIDNYEKENNVKVTQINEIIMTKQYFKVYYEDTQNRNILYCSIIKTSRDSSAMVNYYRKNKLKIKQIAYPNIVEDDMKYFCDGEILYLQIFEC